MDAVSNLAFFKLATAPSVWKELLSVKLKLGSAITKALFLISGDLVAALS